MKKFFENPDFLNTFVIAIFFKRIIRMENNYINKRHLYFLFIKQQINAIGALSRRQRRRKISFPQEGNFFVHFFDHV